MPSTVTCRVEGHIAQVRLDRPDKLNALTLDTLQDHVDSPGAVPPAHAARSGDRGRGRLLLRRSGLRHRARQPATSGPLVRPSPVPWHQPLPGGLLGLAPPAGSRRRGGPWPLLRRRPPDRPRRGPADDHGRCPVVGAGGEVGANPRHGRDPDAVPAGADGRREAADDDRGGRQRHAGRGARPGERGARGAVRRRDPLPRGGGHPLAGLGGGHQAPLRPYLDRRRPADLREGAVRAGATARDPQHDHRSGGRDEAAAPVFDARRR